MVFNSESIPSLEKARLLVVSDSHGSRTTLETIIRNYGDKCDALCFCGDGIDDLLSVIEESQFDEALARCIPEYIFIVQGNGDGSTYRINLRNNSSQIIKIPMNLDFKSCGFNVMMSHGHEYDVYYGMDYLYDASIVHNAKLVLFGHTHLANVQTTYGITLLNPGSCARPRGGMPHTFAIITLDGSAKSISYEYLEIKSDENKKISFESFKAPEGDLPLLW